MQFKHIREGIFRVFADNENTCMLSRYGIVKDGAESRLCDGKGIVSGIYTFDATDHSLSVTGGKRDMTVSFAARGEGFEIRIPLGDKERLYGLGDSSRDKIMRRGSTVRMFIRNVLGYGPMPYLMSADGWAIFVNCTYEHTFDIGDTAPDLLTITAKKGTLDFYIFRAESMKALSNIFLPNATRSSTSTKKCFETWYTSIFRSIFSIGIFFVLFIFVFFVCFNLFDVIHQRVGIIVQITSICNFIHSFKNDGWRI